MADTMDGRLDELTARLAGVEGRLAAMEQALTRLAPPPSPVAQSFQSFQSAYDMAHPPGSEEAEGHGSPVPVQPLPPHPGPPAAYPSHLPPPLPVQSLQQRMAAARQRVATAPPPPPRARRDFEAMIGRNWTSWVGAIVLVLGVLFFLKFAWEQGWLALSPVARVAMAVGAGVLLGLAGEWVRRRGMRVLAGTLSGAGVAIVMAAFFAGHTMFDQPLFSAKVALAGVCAAAAAGIWRALRINAVSLAIIALLGAYIAPAILRSGRDESLLLMGYLAALAGAGWALAYLKPRWVVLRWFVWTCTVLWVGAWVAWYPLLGHHRSLGLAAVTFFFAGFLGEAFLSLHRAFRIRDENDPSRVPGFATPLENSLATLSMLTTAAAFAAYYAMLRGTSPAGGGMLQMNPAAAVAVGLACVHAMIALATPSRQFARSSILQAGALVTLAIPLAFGQVVITLAWLILAAALAGLGWRRDNKAVRAWSVVLVALAVGRLFVFDWADPSLQAVVLKVGGHEITRWLLLAWATAALAHGVGWMCLTPRGLLDPTLPQGARPPRSQLGTAVAIAGTFVFFVATAMVIHGGGSGGSALTILWLAGVATLLALAPRAQRLAYVEQAGVALMVVALKWLMIDGFAPIAAAWDQPMTAVTPFFNGITLAGVLLIALIVWTQRRLAAQGQAISPVAEVAAAAIGFALLNFETLRAVDYFAARFADFVTAKQVALSVLWGLAGLALVVIGFARKIQPLRYAALALLGVTLLKILFVDLAQVRPVYRILSFLAVGALLLCVSFVYHRQEEPTRTGPGEV